MRRRAVLSATHAALAWAGAQADSEVVDSRRLDGGMTSTMLALTHADGAETVLRLIDVEPWRTHGAGLAARESAVQSMLGDTDVPAPRSLALDADGHVAGVAAHLMTLLPGARRAASLAHAEIEALAETLAGIHAVRPTIPVRAYQSWAFEAKYLVPSWARHPSVWTAAFELLRGDPPAFEPTFLHRDFQPANVLWDDSAAASISGVVDWVETSIGPAWLDVAHCATNLALHDGPEQAAAFADAYTRRTGRTPVPFYDVMDVVGFLPRDPAHPMLRDPAEQHRLEERLVDVMDRVERIG